MDVVTIAQRRAAKIARLTAAFADLKIALSVVGAELGGRFLIFGSAARGELRHDSDIDILLDFPEDKMSAAWSVAEDACARLSLPCDISHMPSMDNKFLDHVLPEVIALP